MNMLQVLKSLLKTIWSNVADALLATNVRLSTTELIHFFSDQQPSNSNDSGFAHALRVHHYFLSAATVHFNERGSLYTDYDGGSSEGLATSNESPQTAVEKHRLGMFV